MSATQQDSVSTAMSRPFPGTVETNLANRSYVSEEATAEIPFGIMLARGSADPDNGCLLPNTSSASMIAAFIGVSMHSHAYAKDEELGDDGLKPTVMVGALTRGSIWVLPEDTVEPGDPVRVRVVATGEEQAGAFRSADPNDADCVLLSPTCARWLTSGSSTVPALLEVNFPCADGTADS